MVNVSGLNIALALRQEREDSKYKEMGSGRQKHWWTEEGHLEPDKRVGGME